MESVSSLAYTSVVISILRQCWWISLTERTVLYLHLTRSDRYDYFITDFWTHLIKMLPCGWFWVSDCYQTYTQGTLDCLVSISVIKKNSRPILVLTFWHRLSINHSHRNLVRGTEWVRVKEQRSNHMLTDHKRRRSEFYRWVILMKSMVYHGRELFKIKVSIF